MQRPNWSVELTLYVVSQPADTRERPIGRLIGLIASLCNRPLPQIGANLAR